MKPLLEISGLHFTYPQYNDTDSPPEPIFRGLDLSIMPGEFRIIAGAPESGKTTLSRIVSGLVPRYTGGEFRGSVRVDGQDVAESKPQDLITKAGLIFQNPDEQILTTRVDSEIAFPLESLCLPRGEIVHRVQRELERFELSEMAERNPASLSGGEKKRLLCAVLAAVGPPLWILDETLDEIDPRWQRRILRYLREMKAAVLMLSSKYTPLEGGFPDNPCILAGGRIETSAELLNETAEREGLLLRESAGTRSEAHATDAPPLISVRGIEYSYRDNADFKLAVEELELRAGEVLTLAGPNGCGKTTLARLLCGLYRPAKGSIQLNQTPGAAGRQQYLDAAPASPTPSAASGTLRTSVAYIFQNPDYQIFLPTVREELAYGLKEQHMDSSEIERRVTDAARLFRLPPLDTAPPLMSYGCRKRLQAAVYWLLDRPVVILDEADSGLAVRDLLEIIEAFRSGSRAILFITHSEEFARRFSDRIVLMRNGRIVEEDVDGFFSGEASYD
ncbi:MAG: ABC transporter ATP-binding protein [Spirochaetota bacterium]|nr:ABC transporter ATP-binding protein [Spirochaetota bacterium]